MFYSYLSNMIGSNGWLYSLITIVFYVLFVIGLWRMFDKAGEAGWKSIIPVYNFYILFKISWKPSMFWWFLLVQVLAGAFAFMASNMMMVYAAMVCEILGAIMIAVLFYNVSLAYGHGFGYFLGLYIFPYLFVMIIGMGSSQYAGNRYENPFHHQHAYQ